mgnify:CR=1 FL=1
MSFTAPSVEWLPLAPLAIVLGVGVRLKACEFHTTRPLSGKVV